MQHNYQDTNKKEVGNNVRKVYKVYKVESLSFWGSAESADYQNDWCVVMLACPASD